jgi:hypothetical protein
MANRVDMAISQKGRQKSYGGPKSKKVWRAMTKPSGNCEGLVCVAAVLHAIRSIPTHINVLDVMASVIFDSFVGV